MYRPERQETSLANSHAHQDRSACESLRIRDGPSNSDLPARTFEPHDMVGFSKTLNQVRPLLESPRKARIFARGRGRSSLSRGGARPTTGSASPNPSMATRAGPRSPARPMRRAAPSSRGSTQTSSSSPKISSGLHRIKSARRGSCGRSSTIAWTTPTAIRFRSRVLGLYAIHGRARVYAPWVDRILGLPLSWAPKHGMDRTNFARLRRKLRGGKVPRGHGARLLAHIKLQLATDGQV